MAYSLNNGDIVQCTFQYGWSGVRALMNVLHYRLQSGGVFADGRAELVNLALELSNDAITGFAQKWKDLASQIGANIDRILVQKIYPVRYAKVELDTGITGLAVGEALPPPVQLAITKRGELATRYSVGGIRVPSVGTSFEVNGELTADGLVKAQALADTLKRIITPAGSTAVWEPVVYRRLFPGSSVLVHDAFAHPIFRTQRTRIPGKGI